MKYGRKDELESDSFGLKSMSLSGNPSAALRICTAAVCISWRALQRSKCYNTRCAGFSPREMLAVMQILGEASGDAGKGRVAEWASTHPLSEHRKDDIMKWIKQEFPDGLPGNVHVRVCISVCFSVPACFEFALEARSLVPTGSLSAGGKL